MPPDDSGAPDFQDFLQGMRTRSGMAIGIESGAGRILLLDDVRHCTGIIGYRLSELYGGRGITTDAVRSLVPVAFERCDIVRLHAGIFSNNPASL